VGEVIGSSLWETRREVLLETADKSDQPAAVQDIGGVDSCLAGGVSVVKRSAGLDAKIRISEETSSEIEI
jgi:hypothetical protein